jgi:uncharacterized protein (TIGR03437 family)
MSRSSAIVLMSILSALAPLASADTPGYWRYVRTEVHVTPPGRTTYTETPSGGENSFTDLAQSYYNGTLTADFSVTFNWPKPPLVLIPGTPVYWPISAAVNQNDGNGGYIYHLGAGFWRYSTAAHYTDWYLGSTVYPGRIDVGTNSPAGTVLTFNNATQAQPSGVPKSDMADASGLMSWLVYYQVNYEYYWNYVYEWVSGSQGSCGGTCTLASSGQSLGIGGGAGSVNVTATSSWNAIALDSWIAITSSPVGTGNGTVTYAVAANTTGPRSGTLIVGGQQYTIEQDGTTGGGASGGGPGLGTTNIALDKTVTVDSRYPGVSGTASNIASAPFTSQFYAYQGSANYCSVVVDLRQTYSLGKIEIEPLQTMDYQLYGSTDGTNYSPLASHTWPVYVTLPVSVAIDGASSARYIKYVGHTSWAQWVGLGGMRVYEWLAAAPAAQPSSAYGTTDLAQGKSATNLPNYTSASANPPANVGDGNASTVWNGTNHTYYGDSSSYDFSFAAGGVQIDLGQATPVGKIVVTPAGAQAAGMYLTTDPSTPANYAFFSDQTMFGTATTGSTAQTFYLDGAITARYVWLYDWNLTPGKTAVYPGIAEVAVYGFNGGSSPGGCSYALSATSATAAAAGASGSVTVAAGPPCTWTAQSNTAWITISDGATGTGDGTVSFAAAANAGAARSGTLTIAGQTVTISQDGATQSAVAPGGIIAAGAFGAFPTVAPGSWIEIYGSNLAPSVGTWTAADFSGVNAPRKLNGVTVTIGGQTAFPDYVSPTQINAQVPSNVGLGTQPVIATTADGSSDPAFVNVAAEAPGLLAPSSFNVNGTQYVAALFSDNSTFVLPTGAISGLQSRPAKAGEIITLYGIGFGAVTPNIPAGQIVQQINSLAAPFHLFIDGVEAGVQYDGLAPSAIGLYQFNVVVPKAATGNAVPVMFTLAGAAGTQTLSIATE